jgi:hypothetical protein
MVHALGEIWRTLRPGGLLVDLRPFLPFRPLEVVGPEGTESLGRLDGAPFDADDVAADASIAEVSRRGWFRLETADSFYFSFYWDSIGELESFLEDWTTMAELSPAMAARAGRALQAAPAGTRLRLEICMIFNTLRRVEPAAR